MPPLVVQPLALGLAGIYGVIGYMLAQRKREIGIRVALGAPDAALKRLLLGRILIPVLAGIASGWAQPRRCRDSCSRCSSV